MPDVITEWRVKAERNLCNEFVSYGIDHCHVLIFQIDVRVIGANCYSRVADKDSMIDRIIFYSIWTICWVELNLGDDVKRTMLINNVDNTISNVTDKDLTNILSDQNASSLGNVDQANNLVELGIEDNDVPVGRSIEMGVV